MYALRVGFLVTPFGRYLHGARPLRPLLLLAGRLVRPLEYACPVLLWLPSAVPRLLGLTTLGSRKMLSGTEPYNRRTLDRPHRSRL